MLPVFCQKQPVMACMMQAYVYSYGLRTGFLGALRHACRLSLPRRFAPFAFAGTTRRFRPGKPVRRLIQLKRKMKGLYMFVDGTIYFHGVLLPFCLVITVTCCFFVVYPTCEMFSRGTLLSAPKNLASCVMLNESVEESFHALFYTRRKHCNYHHVVTSSQAYGFPHKH